MLKYDRSRSTLDIRVYSQKVQNEQIWVIWQIQCSQNYHDYNDDWVWATLSKSVLNQIVQSVPQINWQTLQNQESIFQIMMNDNVFQSLPENTYELLACASCPLVCSACWEHGSPFIISAPSRQLG